MPFFFFLDKISIKHIYLISNRILDQFYIKLYETIVWTIAINIIIYDLIDLFLFSYLKFKNLKRILKLLR